MRPSLRVSTPLLLALSLASGAAHAWDRDTHIAIVRAAIRIAPDVEAHIPPGYPEALLSSAAEADLADRDCRYHMDGPPDAAARAEKALNQILSDKEVSRPYLKAQAVGRYLHYVADSSIPRAFAELGPPGFFSGADFVIFRQSRPIGDPFAEKLREIGRDADWGEESSSSRAAAFRLAVNLVTDALLRLPRVAEPSPKGSAAAGEVLFICYGSAGGDTPGKRMASSLPYRNGLRVAEWTKSATGRTVRALLVNNDPKCATNLKLEHQSWRSVPAALTIAPWGVRVVEVEGPERTLEPNHVRGTFDAFACKEPYPRDSGARARRLMVSTGTPSPRIENSMDITP